MLTLRLTSFDPFVTGGKEFVLFTLEKSQDIALKFLTTTRSFLSIKYKIPKAHDIIRGLWYIARKTHNYVAGQTDTPYKNAVYNELLSVY